MPALTRRGVGLPELLISLALGGVIVATAATGLLQQVRRQRDREDRARADAIVREVVEILRAELSHATGAVRVLGDTAVQLESQRLLAVACETLGARLVLPTAADWWSGPRPGDSLAVVDTLTRAEWRAGVAAVGTQRASPACPSGGVRLTLSAPPPATVPVLALPVRVWRVARFTAYRAGDGLWWVGERSCGGTCGVAQPVTGPVRPPAVGGLRFGVHADAEGRAVALDLEVRALIGGGAAAASARLPLASVP